jgi:hypothetical protein
MAGICTRLIYQEEELSQTNTHIRLRLPHCREMVQSVGTEIKATGQTREELNLDSRLG